MGNKITELREKSGLSQAELGRLTGISQPHLHRLESGTRNLSEKHMKAIANALNVPVGTLMGEAEASLLSDDRYIEIAQLVAREIMTVCAEEKYMPSPEDFGALLAEAMRSMLDDPKHTSKQVRKEAANILKFQARKAAR